MSYKQIFTIVILVLSQPIFAQTYSINILDSGHKASLRGLSVVDDNTIWASGSSGTVARSLDGGRTFQWLTVKGFEKSEFRDIEGFDGNTAIIIAITQPAAILKTNDGGVTWRTVFTDTIKDLFLDAMSFYKNDGIVIGDPINDYAFIVTTSDSGEHWTRQPDNKTVKLQKGEAFFAASGTNVKLLYDGLQHSADAIFVSGGSKSGMIADTSYAPIPIAQGSASQGANSIDILGNKAIVVGGDFSHDTATYHNCVLFDFHSDNPISFPQTPPHGYRSCVVYINKDKLVTCGTSGVDISNDGGLNWQLISTQSFHVCQKSKRGGAVFLAGNNGKIAKLEFKY